MANISFEMWIVLWLLVGILHATWIVIADYYKKGIDFTLKDTSLIILMVLMGVAGIILHIVLELESLNYGDKVLLRGKGKIRTHECK